MPDALTVTPFPTEAEGAAAEAAAKAAKTPTQAETNAAAAASGAKPIREISELSPAQQEKWKLEGIHPDLEATPPAKDPADGEGDGAVSKTPPPPADKSPRRLGYGELRARVKELEAELAAKAAAADPGAPPKAADDGAAPPEPKVGKLRPRPDAADVKADGTPKYEKWSDYEDDLLAWADEKRELATAAKTAEATKTAEITAANKAIEDAWWNRVETSRKLHPDFDLALDKGGPGDTIQAGSLLDGWIMHSELGAEVFYYLHKNPDYFEKLKAMVPIKATKALAKLEDELEASTAAPAAPKPPAVRTSKTPAPPSTVGGRGTVAVDEVDRAVAEDNVRGYIDAANRREIEAAKSRR